MQTLKTRANLEHKMCKKLLRQMRKAAVHVPGIEEVDMTNELKCEQWIKKSKGIKGKIMCSMQ